MMGEVSWSDSTGLTLLAIPTWMLPSTRWPSAASRCSSITWMLSSARWPGHPQVEQIYRAMRTFDDLMNSEENHIRLKMKPGDMVTVKNMRVMHGRSGFKKIIQSLGFTGDDWRGSFKGKLFEHHFCARSELKGGISGRSLQVWSRKQKLCSLVGRPFDFTCVATFDLSSPSVATWTGMRSGLGSESPEPNWPPAHERIKVLNLDCPACVSKANFSLYWQILSMVFVVWVCCHYSSSSSSKSNATNNWYSGIRIKWYNSMTVKMEISNIPNHLHQIHRYHHKIWSNWTLWGLLWSSTFTGN